MSSRKGPDMTGKPKCPVEKNNRRPVGSFFKKKILEAYAYCREKDQNYTILCSGVTGGGKSTLMLHKNLILGQMDFERMAFSIPTMASSYKVAKELRDNFYDMYKEMFLGLGFSDKKAHKMAKKESAGVMWDVDELKVYSSKHASSFNTDFFDLMLSVRYKNYFVWANAPSPRSIDRKFLEEKIFDAFIYVHAAQARYWWFSYDSFMRMNKDFGSYDAPIIEKYGDYYADFDGYFHTVPDDVFSEYEEYKRSSVDDVEDKFIETYSSGEVYSLSKASDAMNHSPNTVKKYVSEMQAKGLLPEKLKNNVGHWRIKEEMLKKIGDYILIHSNSGGGFS